MRQLDRSRISGLFFLLVAVVCGLAAAALVGFIALQSAPSVPVYTAARTIAAGDPIKPDMLQVMKMPRANLYPDVIRPGADLSWVVAAHGMAPGDMLRQSGVINLSAPDPAVLSARLLALNNPNLRAMEVPVEAAAGMLSGMKAGDRVDVIAVAGRGPGQGQEPVKRTILRGVPVVGVQPSGDSGAGVLVVGVTPEQAEDLAYARAASKVYASLLPFGGGS